MMSDRPGLRRVRATHQSINMKIPVRCTHPTRMPGGIEEFR